MKVGLLLEGGAMRGLYTAGVLDILMQNNISIDGIMGVSAGALFGMNYKSKQIGRILRYNKKYCNNKNYMGMYSWLTTGNIMNEEFCFDKLVNELDPVDFDTFKNSNEEFYAVVTNIESGETEYKKIKDFDTKSNIEYLRASGSMPYVSKPVIIENKKYLDGGIADSIPIEKMMSMGYDKIIVVLTRTNGYRKKKGNSVIPKIVYRKYPKFVDAINNRYKRYNEQVEKIIELENNKKIFVFRPSKLVNIKRIEKDENKIQQMYDLGMNDCKESLEELIDYLKK